VNNQIEYAIDPKLSQFTVQAFTAGLVAMVTQSPNFAVRDFRGCIRALPETLAEASVQITINASSLDIIDEVSSDHRAEIERKMFHEILQIARFPEIEFQSTDIRTTKIGESRYNAAVTGMLSMHGITKQHFFSTQAVVTSETIRGLGDFKVKLSNHGMPIPSFPGGAMRDELKLKFCIIAQRQA
jgi:polyisoprenoid-binding protein YceI